MNFVTEAEEAGDYIVGMRYAFGEFEGNATTDGATNQLPSRGSISIYVNGEKADTLQMDKTSLGWNEYFTGSKRLTLKKGQNLITYMIDNGNTGSVNLDYLTMYKADVPYTETEIKPQSITLDKANLTLKEGETKTVSATVLPENTENKNVIFVSSDENIAVVDTQGNITAKVKGTAIITAKAEADQNIKAECNITIEKAQEPQRPKSPQEPTASEQPGSTYRPGCTHWPNHYQKPNHVGGKRNRSSVPIKNTRKTKAVKTGDKTNILLTAGIAALGLSTAVTLIIRRRKRE